MKKWFLIIGTILLIVLLGGGMITLHGHDQRNYSMLIKLGHNDVVDSNYHDALNYFQGAYKVSPNGSQARNDLDQTQSYVNGHHYLNQLRLRQAAKNDRRAIKIGAIAALNRRSLMDYKRVIIIQRGIHQFMPLYDHALILNHRNDFRASNQRLDQIFKNPKINLAYFKPFKAKALKLFKTNHRRQRSDQVSSGLRNSRNTSQFKLKAPNIIKNNPSKVTVAKARREIKRAGVNVHEMNDQDVANLIRQANKHHASIYQYAKANY